MTPAAFRQLVRDLRSAQTRFFSSRDKGERGEALREAKYLEKRVDEELASEDRDERIAYEGI